MAKLHFFYGAMGCSKTANALMTKFQYESRGRKVWLIKPSIDTRDDIITGDNTQTILKSRIGLSERADVIHPYDDITILYYDYNPDLHPDVIIADESQFFTSAQIEQLKWLSSIGVPVLCYGLRSDFKTELFPGSKRLFELSDDIRELKSICDCGELATVNARFSADGRLITEGEQIALGGDDKYKALCWKCWKELIKKQGGK